MQVLLIRDYFAKACIWRGRGIYPQPSKIKMSQNRTLILNVPKMAHNALPQNSHPLPCNKKRSWMHLWCTKFLHRTGEWATDHFLQIVPHLHPCNENVHLSFTCKNEPYDMSVFSICQFLDRISVIWVKMVSNVLVT